MQRFLYIFIFFQLVFFSLQAQENNVILNDTSSQYNIYKQLFIYEDKADTVNFEAISKPNSTVNFKLHNTSSAPNLGFTNSNYWFNYESDSSEFIDYFLLFTIVIILFYFWFGNIQKKLF